MTSTRTAPVLQPADEIILVVAYFQRRATRKRADARAQIKRDLCHLIEAAQREVARLDADFDLDRSALRNICDTRSIYDAVAELREAEMMASTVAELLAEEAGK